MFVNRRPLFASLLRVTLTRAALFGGPNDRCATVAPGEHLTRLALVLGLLGTMAGSASAKGLGDKGATSISAAAIFNLSIRSSPESDAQLSIRVAPSGDFFIMTNISLGGGLLVGYEKVGQDSGTVFGLEVRCGYYVPLGALGIWSLAGGEYRHTDTVDAIALRLYVPLVYQFTPNFFLGFGPEVTQEVFAKSANFNDGTPFPKTRVLSLTSIVGGAW